MSRKFYSERLEEHHKRERREALRFVIFGTLAITLILI